MMLPVALVELLEALELPPRSAIELSMNDAMIVCAEAALDADVVPVALDALPVRALSRL